MICRRDLPPEHQEFNARWGGPGGFADQSVKAAAMDRLASRFGSTALHARARGVFGFQPDNNATRRAEYPWAFFAVPVLSGGVAVDVGGSLGGLQFVLARSGMKVINVDPSDAADMGWPVDHETIGQLNKAFGTDVELRKTFLGGAGIAASTVDTVYCISTIEHIPEVQVAELLQDIRRVLKPGGHAVLTVDLFFDLAPFTNRASNLHGTNIDVKALVDASGMVLSEGNTHELNGFPEFDPPAVLARAMEFAQGDIALNVAQALVLENPA